MPCTAIGPKVLLVGKFLPTGKHWLSLFSRRKVRVCREKRHELWNILYLSDLRSPPPPRRIGLWAGAFSQEENGSAGNWCPGHGEAGSNFTCSRRWRYQRWEYQKQHRTPWTQRTSSCSSQSCRLSDFWRFLLLPEVTLGLWALEKKHFCSRCLRFAIDSLFLTSHPEPL